MRKGKGVADHWNKRAHQEGYAARSAFKLDEMDNKHRLLAGAQRVVDLGCRPGSWSQYVRRQAGQRVRLVGVDILPLPDFPGIYLEQSVLELDLDRLKQALGGPADLVLSDMAPLTSGQPFADHCAQIELARRALDIARDVLRPGGRFVAKVFDGEDAPAYVQEVRAAFEHLHRMRPEATRSSSREFFVVALGYRF